MTRLWVALALFLAMGAHAAPSNQLANHPSPYLALHGKDPTAWQEWNSETVERAKRENKLLFVSIGYFACHWCHVMQRESYQNPQIAKRLNESFIPVKVDRELHGALDNDLQQFASRTRGQSGWPLNVFITPEGFPLFAVLYAPPEEFEGMVSRLQERWGKDSKSLKVLARQAALPAASKERVGESKFAPAVGALYEKRFVQEAMAQADTFRGGFGNVNKFPMSPQLMALMQQYQKTGDEKLGAFLRLTLDQMASQGLYDHIGGGFFRYTVDPDWHIPHFEKMLYDNAQLARVYLVAARTFNEPRYREVALETLDFALRELRDPATKAFMTSTSAIDDEGVEGGTYLWAKEDLEKLLTPEEFALVSRLWRLDLAPDLEHGYLPVFKRQPTVDERKAMEPVHKKLMEARQKRSLPKDDKLLTSLNGLMLWALSDAAQFGDKYRGAADELSTYLMQSLWRDGKPVRAYSKGQFLGDPELDDYAYLASGLDAFQRLVAKGKDQGRVHAILRDAWDKFFTPTGWRLQQRSLLANQSNDLVVPDGATFSPAGLVIHLSWHSGDKSLRTKALSALNSGYKELDQGTFWFATQVATMGALQP